MQKTFFFSWFTKDEKILFMDLLGLLGGRSLACSEASSFVVLTDEIWFQVTADRYGIATRCGLESPVKKWNAGLVAYWTFGTTATTTTTTIVQQELEMRPL